MRVTGYAHIYSADSFGPEEIVEIYGNLCNIGSNMKPEWALNMTITHKASGGSFTITIPDERVATQMIDCLEDYIRKVRDLDDKAGEIG